LEAEQTMSAKIYPYKYLILKQANGLRLIAFKDSGVAHGIIKGI